MPAEAGIQGFNRFSGFPPKRECLNRSKLPGIRVIAKIVTPAKAGVQKAQ